MKSIFVPTDFSVTAGNAMAYATQMARISGARLVLFHACTLPVITTEVPVPIISSAELERDALLNLKKIAERLRSDLGIEVVCEVSAGFAAEEIVGLAEKHQADWIVMGMRGSSAFVEKWIGSITTDVMRRISIPVIAVPESFNFRYPEKIALAIDGKGIGIGDPLNIEPLRDLLHHLRADLLLLNVVSDQATASTVNLLPAEIGISASYHKVVNEDVINGINAFTEEHDVGMIAVIPHEHSWLQRLMHRSISKQMAFHATVPVLSLPEH